MSHVAVIVGISGAERFLARGDAERETTERRRAKRFRSEESAARAAREHIDSFARCIARYMAFRVELDQ